MRDKIFILFIGIAIGCTLLGFGIGRITYPPLVSDNSPGQVIPRDTLSEWQVLEMAIAKTESDFNYLALGKAKDAGILQLTPPYIKDVNRILGKDEYIHEDAFSPNLSLEMFNIVQANYNPDRNVAKAIRIHNPKGEGIGYSRRVLQNIEWIKRYEHVRALVLEGD